MKNGKLFLTTEPAMILSMMVILSDYIMVEMHGWDVTVVVGVRKGHAQVQHKLLIPTNCFFSLISSLLTILKHVQNSKGRFIQNKILYLTEGAALKSFFGNFTTFKKNPYII